MLKPIHYTFLCALFLGIANVFSQATTIIDEDFSSGTLPAGWSNVNNGGTAGQIWQINAARPITAGNFSGNYAILDSDTYGSGSNQNASLLTSTFSADLYETLTLEFDYQYRDYDGGESCVVDVFNGTTWVEVFRKEFGEENYVSLSNGADLESIDIKAAAGTATNAQVRFTYIGVWDYWWAIDNVKVSGDLFVPTNTSHLGPGGVGAIDATSDLILWLDASRNTSLSGTSITGWSDLSGNGNNATPPTTAARPNLITSDVNSYSSIDFDGTNDELRITDNASLDLTSWNFFAVSKADLNKNYNAIFTKGNDSNENYELLTFSNGLFHTPLKYTDASRDSPNSTSGQYSTTNFDVFEYSFSGIGRDVYKNNTSILTDNVNKTPLVNNLDLYIGNERSTTGRFLNGRISELIFYNQPINLAERIIVSNYLSAKFGRTLNTIDFYDEDTSGGNFDHDVAGIGQATDGSNHTDSQGTGIVRIYNPSALGNDEFLIWGRDNKDALTFVSNTSNYQERISTKWRVSKRNDLGNVSFILDLNGIDISGKQSCSNLKLVVDNDSDLLSPTSTYELTDLGGNLYKANNVVFANNDYFTIEYRDLIVLDGTQFYNGSGTANVPDITDDCYKLLVKSTANGSLTLTEDADVREVEIEAGGKLVVNSGFRLQVTNGLEINGDLRLVGDSQLIQTHTGTSLNSGTGNLYKDQNSDLASVYRYNYWSSPVTEVGGTTFSVEGVMKNGTTATSATSTPPDLNFTTNLNGNTSPLTLSSSWIYSYVNGDGGSGGYALKLESGSFNAGEGFLLKSPGAAQNYTFKGAPNDGDISFSIDVDHTSLLGNPYPSAVDANLLFTESTNIAALYFWEHKNELEGSGIEGHYKAGYIGGYGTRNATMGTAATTAVSGTAGLGGETYTAPGRYIPVGQGFFVETVSGLAATVNFKNSQRIYITEAGDSHFFKLGQKSKKQDEKEEGLPFIKVGFEAKDSEGIYLHSQIGISFQEGNTIDYEVGFDSKKYEMGESDIYFKFPNTTDELVIAGIGKITDDLEIPITVKINSTDDTFLMIDDTENINREMFFKDALTNTTYTTEKPIKLEVSNGTYENRFYIVFGKDNTDVDTGKDDEDDDSNDDTTPIDIEFSFYQDYNRKELIITNKFSQFVEKVTLFNLLGQKVVEYSDESVYNRKEISINTDKIASQVYIIHITTKDDVLVKKISLR
ncbi:T9SS type A sorting domain-containing protein [Polaribacter haliotis]|uniref:T9SS type A sorting domain-containing protein n=1 Tax=Polaribacter haliotis TaxID=1888915 RepID=A0A7L8ABU3_9FLAO|nr:T9SS type A sorting domain-containing protein [Polaribacter haliotis]QOD59452.1 T9SS type A sorting domain-containing protein [Polaribacter haliotis]